MTLVVTVAGTTSDSYATLVEASAHATAMANTAWAALSTDAVREAYLRRATRLIDFYFWAGTRYDYATVTAGRRVGQALEFPRHFNIDGTGAAFIPADVKACCCEVAFALVAGAAAESTDAVVSDLKLGGMTISFEAGSGATGDDAGDIIRQHLGHYMANSVRC